LIATAWPRQVSLPKAKSCADALAMQANSQITAIQGATLIPLLPASSPPNIIERQRQP
jgi:hypothetical protein